MSQEMLARGPIFSVTMKKQAKHYLKVVCRIISLYLILYLRSFCYTINFDTDQIITWSGLQTIARLRSNRAVKVNTNCLSYIAFIS